MTPQELQGHKEAAKKLRAVPVFRSMKQSSRLPKPFDRMKGRLHTSGEITVGEAYKVFIFWRDGEELSDSAFMAWLMFVTRSGSLIPLFEFHYHPSHKGVHAKLPCRTELDYAGRQLPAAPEFNLKTQSGVDPRSDEGRLQLLHQFCVACGIEMNDDGDLWK